MRKIGYVEPACKALAAEIYHFTAGETKVRGLAVANQRQEEKIL